MATNIFCPDLNPQNYKMSEIFLENLLVQKKSNLCKSGRSCLARFGSVPAWFLRFGWFSGSSHGFAVKFAAFLNKGSLDQLDLSSKISSSGYSHGSPPAQKKIIV